MNMIIFWATLFSLLTAHQPSEESPIPNLGSGFNSGLYINYDTSTLDIDGIFEFQANNGLFFEIWGNSQINSNTSLNTSVGIIKKINSKLITVGGYSNYIDNNLINHEIFFGWSINFFTAITFSSFEQGDLLFNHLGIIDINSLVPKLPFDLTLNGISSTELSVRGNDFFINFSKNFQSGLYLGYAISRERYEDEQMKTFMYIKDGETFTKTQIISVPAKSFFNTLSLGITF